MSAADWPIDEKAGPHYLPCDHPDHDSGDRLDGCACTPLEDGRP